MTIWKTFTFDSAHWLPKVPVGHKCGRVHGHTYQLTVYVTGEPDESGMIIDYADLASSKALLKFWCSGVVQHPYLVFSGLPFLQIGAKFQDTRLAVGQHNMRD